MKITLKGWIHAHRYEWEDEYSYTFFSCNMDGENGYIPIMEHEITFTLPANFKPTVAEIAALKKEQERIRAEAQSKVNLIQERISKLLAIEHKPAEAINRENRGRNG